MTASASYHETRLSHDPRREVVWKTLWRHYFRHIVPADGCVLDIGCGYGDFINQVEARRRVAIDLWSEFPRYLDPGVEPIIGDVTRISQLDDHSVDFAFASNIFEHLPQPAFAEVLAILRTKLSARGTLTILQPNWRYAYREYFDDYTHVSVYSDVSITDFLTSRGYEVIEVTPRFLPLTVKSRLPVSPWLIRCWLASPFKPIGKQMLIRARPVGSGRAGV